MFLYIKYHIEMNVNNLDTAVNQAYENLKANKDKWDTLMTLQKDTQSFFETNYDPEKGQSNFQEVWKDTILGLESNPGLISELRSIRQRIATFATSNCSEINTGCRTDCKSFGSQQATSDIDVTLSGSCVDKNLIVLGVVYRILKLIVCNIAQFHIDTNTSTKVTEISCDNRIDLQKVFKFFDVNFYLSNFEIPLPSMKIGNTIDFNNIYTTRSKEQINYAFQHSHVDTGVVYKTTAMELNNLLQTLLVGKKGYSLFSGPSTNSSISQDEKDKVINLISKIASFEDECYLTQGAFFHVVLNMQRKKEFNIDTYLIAKNYDALATWAFMLTCSIIENLKFAMSHTKSLYKYVYRVYHALEQLDRILPSIYNKDLNKQSQRENIISVLGDVSPVVDKVHSSIKQLKEQLIGPDGNFVNLVNRMVNSTTELKKFEKTLENARGNVNYSKDAVSKGEINVAKSQKALNDFLNNKFDILKKTYSEIKNNIQPQNGGRVFKKLCGKDKKPIKKNINGKERVVYVDTKRCQYVKMNGSFKAVAELKKSSVAHKKTTAKKN